MARTPERYQIVALTGGSNIELLAHDARRLNAQLAVTAYEAELPKLRDLLADTSVEVAAGPAALLEAADRPTDWVMSAIVGAAGLAPGVRALRHGGTLALANKESLVTAGPLLMAVAERHDAEILPVDSEHSAVFQALHGEDIASVDKITITASGGAFRDWPLEELAKATVAQASSHPNWNMGQRITIDSASMFNKALELIETKEYFAIDPSRIEAVVHPQSLVHALVQFRDGGVMAHMGAPDMRHAIGYALHYPDRPRLPVAPLDLLAAGSLDFRAADEIRWPALRLARDVMAAGGLAGCVFNAAKEVALDEFIAGKLGFQQMAELVEWVLDRYFAQNGHNNAVKDLDSVHNMDHMARSWATELSQQMAAKG